MPGQPRALRQPLAGVAGTDRVPEPAVVGLPEGRGRKLAAPPVADTASVAGLPEVTIGDTLTDPADPRPLPRLDVDAPTLRMTFGVNTSPMAGRVA